MVLFTLYLTETRATRRDKPPTTPCQFVHLTGLVHPVAKVLLDPIAHIVDVFDRHTMMCTKEKAGLHDTVRDVERLEILSVERTRMPRDVAGETDASLDVD